MQHRPDASTLLDAVAAFLMGEVAPKLETDRALQFRVLIASSLAQSVAQELRTHDARLEAEQRRLAALLPGHPALAALEGPPDGARRAALLELDRALAQRLREGPADAAWLALAQAHLWETAKDTLAVTNPRFDTSTGT